MDTHTIIQAAEPAYREGAHQSFQGWLVLALIALAVLAYRRQSKPKKEGPEKKRKPLGKKLMKFLGLKKKKKGKRTKQKETSRVPPAFITPVREEPVPTKKPSAPFLDKVREDPAPSGPSLPGGLMSKLQKDAWTRMVTEKKIPGLVWDGVEESPFGIGVRVKFEGVMNYAAAQAAVRHIEAGLDVPAGTVRPKAGDTMGGGSIEIRTKTPFPGGLLWEAPSGPVRLADPIHLATTPDGEKVFLNIKQRVLVSGESGSGKSGTQRVISSHVILAEDADLEFWDLKRVEATVYAGKARCVTTVQEAADRLAWLMEEEYPRRMDLMIGRRVTSWRETPEDPALVLMVDEGNDLMRDFSTEQKAQLFSAVEKGRALGVYFVWATQFPKGTNLPTELRSQFSAKVCLRLSSIKESRVVLDEDDVANGWSPHLLDAHWTLLKDRDNKSPREALVPEVKDEVFESLVPGGLKSPGQGDSNQETCPPQGDMSLEDSIMLCLLMSPGPMSGRALAQELGKPRTTVERVVESLIRGQKLVRSEEGLRLSSAPGC